MDKYLPYSSSQYESVNNGAKSEVVEAPEELFFRVKDRVLDLS